MPDLVPGVDRSRPDTEGGSQSGEPCGRLYRYRSWRGAPVPDHQRFLDLTMPHLDTVHNVALGLTRDPHRAEDLVQETYLRAFQSFAQYRGGSLRAWLVSICLNAGRDELRRARRRLTYVDLDTAGCMDLASVRSNSAADTALRLVVLSALARLPEEQRVSVVLCDMAGLTAQEAADLLGCPRGTVLARVHRGRRRLAVLFDAQGVRDDA